MTRIVKSERIYREIDGPLLVMFAGLFVVVAGFETALLTPDVIARVGRLGLDRVPMLSLVTAALSNLVSNVPAVLVLRPFIGAASDPQRAWLTVAMASTLAGNLTILAPAANLIVVQGARAKGVTISFWIYFRTGAPLTVLTILIEPAGYRGDDLFSESAFIELSRRPEWDEWYKGHLAAMASVPGVLSAQRFAALDKGVPQSLAMYTVTSPAVFESEVYLRVRGMGPWVGLVDETQHRRNLFDGLDTAPGNQAGRSPRGCRPGRRPTERLRVVAHRRLDRSTPYRGIAVYPGHRGRGAPCRRRRGAALPAGQVIRN